MSRRSTAGRNGRRGERLSTPQSAGLSILFHAGIAAILIALGAGDSFVRTDLSTAFDQKQLQKPPEDVDLVCLLDELTTTATNLFACAVPGASWDACAEDALDRLDVGRLACHTSKPIDIAMIEPEVLNPMAARPDPDETKAVELKQEEPKLDDPKVEKQVVEIAKPEVEVRPDDDAKYLSEYDSKVKHEMRGKAGEEVVRKEKAQPAVPQVDPQAQQDEQKQQSHGGGTQLAMRDVKRDGSQRDGHDAPGTSPDGQSKTSPDGSGAQGGDGGAKGSDVQPNAQQGKGADNGGKDQPSHQKQPNLKPSQEVIEHATGGSTDYLKDVDDGEETLLNTKRWKYASFFNRVKHAVQQYYNPENAYRLRDPTGQIYGRKNRLTILKVSLEPDGALRDVLIEHPCGIDFLDDEAVKAFKEAAPFPNPPVGLVDAQSNLITFRFGFYFEITETGSWKIFKYNN
jgi:TonB family protein